MGGREGPERVSCCDVGITPVCSRHRHHDIVYWLAALLWLHYLTRFCIVVDEALCSTDCCQVVMTDGKLEYCVT